MSKANVVLRDISPIMQRLRDFLLGRKHTNALRFEPLLADRTQPQPQIPDGVSHKSSKPMSARRSGPVTIPPSVKRRRRRKKRSEWHAQNYYYTRDGRREVAPPIDLTKKRLAASDDKGAPKAAANLRPTPGPVYQWDKHYE